MSSKDISIIESPKGLHSDVRIVSTLSRQLSWSHFKELGRSGIHVAEYLTALPSRGLLQQKLHAAIENSRERFENLGERE